MSLEEYRRRVLKKIDGEKDEMLTQVANVRFQPRTQIATGPVIPPSTAEEIAFRVVELNARLLALEVARNIVIAEFNALISPPQGEDSEPKPKTEKQKGIY